METVRTAAGAHGDAARAEFMGVAAFEAGRAADAIRDFDEAFGAWLEFARFYYGEQYRDRPMEQVLHTVDYCDPAIHALRAGLPADAISTDVLLEFHLCATGFLSGRIGELLRTQVHHLRTVPVLPRRLADFPLKSAMIMVRVATAELSAESAGDLITRNHEDFEIKAGGLISGVDGPFIHGFRQIDAMTSLALRGRGERSARNFAHLEALHTDARDAFAHTPHRSLLTVADLAHATAVSTARSTVSSRPRPRDAVRRL